LDTLQFSHNKDTDFTAPLTYKMEHKATPKIRKFRPSNTNTIPIPFPNGSPLKTDKFVGAGVKWRQKKACLCSKRISHQEINIPFNWL